MTDQRIERIRERAHRIWEEEGCPEGRDTEHWERAAREIDAEGADAAQGSEPVPGETGGGGQGLASGLQGGGTAPGGGPGASTGSVGTGGGSTAGRATGAAKRRTGTGKQSRPGS